MPEFTVISPEAATQAPPVVPSDTSNTDAITLSRLEVHLWEAANILRGPVDAAAVPFIHGSVGLARSGVAAGGTARNRAFVDPHVDWGDLDEPEQLLLADAQTSGGLLIATTDPSGLQGALAARGIRGAVIGITSGDGLAGHITVRGAITGA